jgi:hypothetical protein
MSIGFSISDIIGVTQLSWSTYQRCRNAPKEWREARREVASLSIVLQEIEGEATTPGYTLRCKGSNDQVELAQLICNCREVLEQFRALVKKHRRVGSSGRTIWVRLKFGNVQLGDIRGKLQLHCQALNSFLAARSRLESRKRFDLMQERIDDLAAEFRAGKREPSVLSICEEDSDDFWNLLKSELLYEGIGDEDIEQHKEPIKAYIHELLQRGEFEEQPPEDGDLEKEDYSSSWVSISNLLFITE